MRDFTRQEHHQASADRHHIVFGASIQVHAQLTAVLWQPGVIQVDHRRDHAAIIVAKAIHVPEVESTGRVQREMAFEVFQPQVQAPIQRFAQAVSTFPLGIGFKVDAGVAGTGLLGISNLFLNFMYKLGLPGMLLFIAVAVSWWRTVRPTRTPVVLTADNAIWLGTTLGVLAALVSGLFDHYFSFTQVLIALFWLMLGISLHEALRLKQKASLPFSGVPS